MKKKIECINHDYKETLDDKFLSLLKKVIPFPEVRHSAYDKMARFHFLVPGAKLPKDNILKTTIEFSDGSIPLYFSSPIILSAGSCKYGKIIPNYAYMGYGAVTVGTATANKRLGNPYRPRVSMIEVDRSMNNSFGLNNPGIKVIKQSVESQKEQAHTNNISVGISVGESPEVIGHDERLNDLLSTFKEAYEVADYIEINVSCPNTGNNRVDEDVLFIEQLFTKIKELRDSLSIRKAVYAKLSPDMNSESLYKVLDTLHSMDVNGLVLFNTYPAENSDDLKMHIKSEDIKIVTKTGAKGGLSGRVLYQNTFDGIADIKSKYPNFSIFASGGIDHGAKVWDLLKLGADAVQCYSVVAFRWNAIHKIRKELKTCLNTSNFCTLEEYVKNSKIV